MRDPNAKEILQELVTIKRLLIFIASKSGATQPEIGKILGVSARQVRRILESKD